MSHRNGNATACSAMPQFPVVMKTAGYQPSSDPVAYLVTRDGLFITRETPLFSASVPVDGVAGLEAHRSHLTLKIPPLPVALVQRAIGFFRAVHRRWGGEAILILFYDDEARRYQLAAPPQLIRGRFERGRFRAELRLEYGACERPGPSWVKLGDLHSHGHASPHHSTIDEHDELYETGLHITVGYVDSPVPKFAAAFVVGGTRFTLPADIVPTVRTARRWPEAWMDQVMVSCDGRTVFGTHARRDDARD